MNARVRGLRERALSVSPPGEVGARIARPGADGGPDFMRAALAGVRRDELCSIDIQPGELIIGGRGRIAPDALASFSDPAAPGPGLPSEFQGLVDAGLLITGGCHCLADYEVVLRRGLTGFIADIERSLAVHDDVRERSFLAAAKVAAEGLLGYCRRCAVAAETEAARAASPERRSELLAIADNCAHALTRPPESFWEACQAAFLVYHFVPDSPGRVDQFLYPYYRRDVDAGRLTRAFAKELLSCLWIKYFEHVGKDHPRGGVTHMAVGGTAPDGSCGVNELSQLCLEVTGELGLIRPQVALRWNRDTPREFLRLGVETLRRGTGSPDFCNDERIVPALVRAGVAEADARDFCPSGCHEVMISGKSHMGALMGQFNLPATLPPVMARGAATWDALWDAWRGGMAELVDGIHALSWHLDSGRAEGVGRLVLSLFTAGCVESGRSVDQGGAVYNYCNWDACGVANLADSFLAVKKLVFERRRVGLAEFAVILRDNWEGSEALRREAAALPGFGNGEPEVDAIAAAIIRELEALFSRHTPFRGGRYNLGTLSGYENAHVYFGERTGATPDGRRAGETFAASLSPAAGRDVSGLTAMLNSVASLPHELLPTSTTVNVSLEPALLDTPEGVDKVTDLISAHFQSGGQQLQITLASREDLLDAMAHPERHANLMVRVAGYSAKFTSLEKSVQEEIVKRTLNRI